MVLLGCSARWGQLWWWWLVILSLLLGDLCCCRCSESSATVGFSLLFPTTTAATRHSSGSTRTVLLSATNPANHNYCNDHYVRYWDGLLLEEHAEAVQQLRERRKLWSRQRLEQSGLALFDCMCEADSELFGEKIVRLQSSSSTVIRFARGDIVLLTPPRRKAHQVPLPREGCVVDVGENWMTVAIGPSWLPGLYESRKGTATAASRYRSFGRRDPAYYAVTVEKAAPRAALQAQRSALQVVRKGRAGTAAQLLVETFGKSSMQVDHLGLADPWRFQGLAVAAQKEIVSRAIQEATSTTDFVPNASQQDAIAWSLRRRVSTLTGPPGTGKTKTAACLVATALKLPSLNNDIDDADDAPVRVLAVAHSNGAADVLLQAVLDMGVPAVRVGRPASVSPAVRHRTVLALAEKHPDMTALRRQQYRSATNNATIVPAFRNLQEISQIIHQSAPVVVTSCIGALQLLNDDQGSRPQFDIVVVDEAAQTTEPALLCALAAARAEQLVLVGDTRQLPPTVASENAELRSKLGTSPMERLLEHAGVEERIFQLQYRMHASLLEYPSAYFYNGMVVSASHLIKGDIPVRVGFPWPAADVPLAFVNVEGDFEVMHEFGGKSNPTEADVVASIVARLVKTKEDPVHEKDIAVISPYSKQVQLIQNELVKKNIYEVRVGTVDSFQGQECGVVVFSAVRSNGLNELGFLRDQRRLCVSLTRAKWGLIVVGDSSTLNSCKHWAALLASCRLRNCFVQVDKVLAELDSNGNVTNLLDPTAGDENGSENSSEKFVFEGISLFD